jgi:hypothetical protein
MKMKMVLLACAATALATSANAATVVFAFGSIADTAHLTTGALGQTATYTLSGLTIVASAFGPAAGGVPDQLYGKNLAGDEIGLGMTNDPSGEHEIYYHDGFIQLDVSALAGKVKANSTYFAMDSTSGGEAWAVYGTNTAGTVGSTVITGGNLVASGTNIEGANTLLTGNYKYYDFVSTANLGGKNVLLTSLTTTVPEPATWGLMLVGFGGLGAMMRRRRAVAVAA